MKTIHFRTLGSECNQDFKNVVQPVESGTQAKVFEMNEKSP